MRKIIYIVLALILAHSQAWGGWVLNSYQVATGGGGETYVFHLEFDNDTDWSDGYTIGGNDYSAGDQSGTVNGSITQSGTYSVSSPYSANVDWVEHISFAPSGNDIFDGDTGYIRINIYVPSDLTSQAYIINATEATNGRLRVRIFDDETIFVERRDTSGSTVSFQSTATVSLATWTQVDIRWSAVNDDLDIRIGTGSWEGTDSAMSALTVDLDDLKIGSEIGPNEGYYIDDLSIWTDYTGPGD